MVEITRRRVRGTFRLRLDQPVRIRGLYLSIGIRRFIARKLPHVVAGAQHSRIPSQVHRPTQSPAMPGTDNRVKAQGA